MKFYHKGRALFTGVLFLWLSALGHAAGTATNILGVYYTGVNSSYGLLSGGATDSHWSVTYASTNGGGAANTTYEGAAYVVDAPNNNPNAIVGATITASAFSSLPPAAQTQALASGIHIVAG